MTSFDLYFISLFKEFSGKYLILNKIIYVFEISDLLSIVPITSLLWWIWFKKDDRESINRKYVIATVIACFLAGLVSYFLVYTNLILDFRPRPGCDPGLGFLMPIGVDPPTAEFCRDSHSTFPSGHAALLFGLSFGILYVSRLMGALCLIYSFLLCLTRIYIGDHYATDIIGGAFIGGAMVYLSNVKLFKDLLANKIWKWSNTHPQAFSVVFFIMCFNIVTYYNDLGRILKAVLKFLKLLLPFFRG
jgi:undecaprenyl-diphosphatase